MSSKQQLMNYNKSLKKEIKELKLENSDLKTKLIRLNHKYYGLLPKCPNYVHKVRFYWLKRFIKMFKVK